MYLDNYYLKEAWGNKYVDNINKLREAVNDTSLEYLDYNGEVIDALFFSIIIICEKAVKFNLKFYSFLIFQIVPSIVKWNFKSTINSSIISRQGIHQLLSLKTSTIHSSLYLSR